VRPSIVWEYLDSKASLSDKSGFNAADLEGETDGKIYTSLCRRNSFSGSRGSGTRANRHSWNGRRDGFGAASAAEERKRNLDPPLVGAHRSPPATCRRCSSIGASNARGPRSGRRVRRSEDQQHLPRLLTSRAAKRPIHFRGLPRLAKIKPRASAIHRSWLASLRASLRCGPGIIKRASSKASAAAMSQSSLSGEPCASLLIA
jgi:hypothetical protein